MALSGCPWWAQRTPVERGGSRLAGARTTLRTPLPTATRMTDTATVYRRVAGARPTRDAEPPIRHVAVVGGGTAGWITALLLAHSGYGRRLRGAARGADAAGWWRCGVLAGPGGGRRGGGAGGAEGGGGGGGVGGGCTGWGGGFLGSGGRGGAGGMPSRKGSLLNSS